MYLIYCVYSVGIQRSDSVQGTVKREGGGTDPPILRLGTKLI